MSEEKEEILIEFTVWKVQSGHWVGIATLIEALKPFKYVGTITCSDIFATKTEAKSHLYVLVVENMKSFLAELAME